MTSLGGKLTALACHLTKKVIKAEELTYLFTNIGWVLGNCDIDFLSFGHRQVRNIKIFNLLERK
jgi:hypothetical protein